MGESTSDAGFRGAQQAGKPRTSERWQEAKTVELWTTNGTQKYGAITLPRMPLPPTVVQCGSMFFVFDLALQKWVRARCHYATVEQGALSV